MKEIVSIIMSLSLSNEDVFWLVVLVLCLVLLGVVETIYRTEPEQIITKTKDKKGNEVIIVSRIKK